MATDSEPVPRGKGEKHPWRGVKRPEPVCLQAIGAGIGSDAGACDGVPIAK